MAFGDADAAIFCQDMGEPVSYGGVTVMGLVDRYDERNSQLAGTLDVVDRLTVVSVPSGSLPGLRRETTVTVSGVAYVVQDILQKNDGGFTVFAAALS